MASAKPVIVGMGLSALAAGFGMYYLQVYAFYEELPAEAADVRMTTLGGEVEEVLVENWQGITSDSSPIRFRACFDMVNSQAMLTETYELVNDAVPLVAPDWFECFDAREVGEGIEAGVVLPFMGVKDITYGVDRIVAVFPDGRGVSWHQINACGEVVFDGDPAPEGCPPVPESLQ